MIFCIVNLYILVKEKCALYFNICKILLLAQGVDVHCPLSAFDIIL